MTTPRSSAPDDLASLVAEQRRLDRRVDRLEAELKQFHELHSSTRDVLSEIQLTLQEFGNAQAEMSKAWAEVRELLATYNRVKSTGQVMRWIGDQAQWVVKAAVAIGAIWFFFTVWPQQSHPAPPASTTIHN